jgi:magnesium transporter
MPFSFLYLSQILDSPVLDRARGRRLGHVADVSADITKIYPNLTGLWVRPFWGRALFFLSAASVEIPESGRPILATLPETPVKPDPVRDGLRLRETFLDKQIVDISGSRVVRVNDLHLLKEDANLWVVHMDVGFSGLLRRLGWLDPYRRAVKWLFNYDLTDRFIQWKYVQPVTDVRAAGTLALKVAYSKLSNVHPADLADILLDLGTEERETAFRSLDPDTAAKTLEKLPLRTALLLLGALPTETSAMILDTMPPDEAADLLAEVPRKRLYAYFRALPKKKVARLKELLAHARHTAGSLMNTEFIAVRFDMPAGQVLEKVISEKDRAESIYYVYVQSQSGTLAGVLTLRQLLGADPAKPVADLMASKVVRVRTDTRLEEVALLFLKYNFNLLPVVDSHNKLKGIISVRDSLESAFPQIKQETEGAS